MSNGTVSITATAPGMQTLDLTGIPWTQGMNVQQAMERAYDDISHYTYAIQYYGSALGYLVVAVQGIYDGGDSFWVYCVNGSFAQTGIDNQTLNSGDQVEFVYRTYGAEERQGVPTIEAKYESAAAST